MKMYINAIDSKTHNKMIDDTIKSAFEDYKMILALEKYKL